MKGNVRVNQKLTKEQQKLVEDNHNLIYGFANRQKLDLEEYYDILAIGLCKAAMIYDENRGRFSTLAYYSMASQVHAYLRHLKIKSAMPKHIMISFDEQIKNVKTEDTLTLLDTITDNCYVEDRVVEGVFLEEVSRCLKGKEKDVFDLLAKDMTYSKIAEQIGVSKQSVGQRVIAIRKKLKQKNFSV